MGNPHGKNVLELSAETTELSVLRKGADLKPDALKSSKTLPQDLKKALFLVPEHPIYTQSISILMNEIKMHTTPSNFPKMF